MSSLGINGMNQLANKFSAMGWGEDRVAQFGQLPESAFRDIEAFMDNRATITVVRKLTTPTEFYLPAVETQKRLKDRKDVWLSPDAAKLFGGDSKLPAQNKRKAYHCDLVKRLSDFELIEALGGVESVLHNSADSLDTAIGQLIAEQAGGAQGKLLNDGKANIFYLRDPNNSERVLYVSVYWSSDDSQWNVHTDEVRDDQWVAGSRVFPATAA